MGSFWRKHALLVLALAAFAAAVLLPPVLAWLGFAMNWPLVLALLVAGAGWGAAAFFRRKATSLTADTSHASAKLPPAASAVAVASAATVAPQPPPPVALEDGARMQALLDLNRILADVSADLLDDRGLIEASLAVINRLTGALGCSFVPVDDWQQPLPALTNGHLPAPVLSAWSAHLADGMLRERCGKCEVLHSTPGGCPLHPQQVGAGMTVFCLQLKTVHRAAHAAPAAPAPAAPAPAAPAHSLGVMHLYLPPGRVLDESGRAFLEALLPEIALAYQSARLRSQEVVTMRQLRMLRAPENDFSASLSGLLAGLAQALEADFVQLRLRPSSDERLSNLSVVHGEVTADGFFDQFALNEAADVILRGENAASAPETLPAWLALPLLLPDGLPNGSDPGGGRVLGMLAVGANRPFSFHPRQRAILQTIAAQAALLVENERMLHSLEYKVVIEERARLAREIHDGLAQTLAFLKLQAAQMQTYLAQGDIARLSAVLKDNYQTLAEAYLDTRQAIDNLRLTPQEGLQSWIERILREFEANAGLHVDRELAPLEHELSPEVQAHMIRILQESLSNVRKHARASRAKVSLREWSGELILEVTDNGLGFDAGDVPEISRHGLRGMRERAEMIGADFQIISQPHRGTTVRLVLPAWLEEETTL